MARACSSATGLTGGASRASHRFQDLGDRYDVTSYRRAIARGCDHAFPPPTPLAKLADETSEEHVARLTADQHQQLKAWRRSHRWHPHQLRHTAGTNFRKEFGLEAAQVLLGHKTLTVTQVYAEKSVTAAQAIMGRVG